MDTTHESNSDWTKDRKAWRQSLQRFSDIYEFDGLDILPDQPPAATKDESGSGGNDGGAARGSSDAGAGDGVSGASGASEGGAGGADRAHLTFRAKLGAPGQRLDFVERSLFLWIRGRWLYAHGDVGFEPTVTAVPGGVLDVTASETSVGTAGETAVRTAVTDEAGGER
ncbi:unnamed protein product [Phaeothamnion confervicola]